MRWPKIPCVENMKVIYGEAGLEVEKRINVCHTASFPGSPFVRQELPDNRFSPIEDINVAAVVSVLRKKPGPAIRLDHIWRRTCVAKISGSIEEVAEVIIDLHNAKGLNATSFREQARAILSRTAKYLATGSIDPDRKEVWAALRTLPSDNPLRILCKIVDSWDVSKAATIPAA